MADHRSKTRAAHKPPARARYEESHPVVSCRLSRDEHELLKQRLDDLGGVSFADFLRDTLGVIKLQVRETQDIKARALKTGYDQSRQDHQIWYFCAVCGERINMSPNNKDHKSMIVYMKEHRWGHANCLGQ